MEPISMMMITLPIYMPIAKSLGFDPLWFGTIILLNMQMACSTPPFGMILFIMKGVAPPYVTMADIYKAGLPFLGCDIVSMTLLILFPSIVLWIPGLMSGMIIAGVDPIYAAIYQFVIIAMGLAVSGLTSLASLVLIRPRVFSSAEQLLLRPEELGA